MDVEGRLAELEARLDALSAAVAAGPPSLGPDRALPPAPPGTWWLLEGLRLADAERDDAGGSVAYGGLARTPGGGQVAWQLEHPVADVLDVDPALAAPVLAALGSPVRLELVRRMLRGATTLAELQAVPGVRTSGQVHHHLRELRAAGLVTVARNSFRLVPARIVPVLVAVAAAAGPDAVPSTPVKED